MRHQVTSPRGTLVRRTLNSCHTSGAEHELPVLLISGLSKQARARRQIIGSPSSVDSVGTVSAVGNGLDRASAVGNGESASAVGNEEHCTTAVDNSDTVWVESLQIRRCDSPFADASLRIASAMDNGFDGAYAVGNGESASAVGNGYHRTTAVDNSGSVC